VSLASAIEWTDDTWPAVVVGCTRSSPGCDHCYIERTMPFRIEGRRFDRAGIGASTGIVFHEERLAWPLHRRAGRKIFANSQSDLFHKEVPTPLLVKLFAVMASARRHDFQILTKRPARMRHLLSSAEFRDQVRQATRLPFIAELSDTSAADWEWPLPNVWGGVSVESQRWLQIRVPQLRATALAVRMISAEPLLSGLQLAPIVGAPLSQSSIDWLILGGESGPGARLMEPDWAVSVGEQCAQLGIPLFFKQAGTELAKRWGGTGKGNDPAGWLIPFPRRFPQTPLRAAA
jgi:protein gp37